MGYRWRIQYFYNRGKFSTFRNVLLVALLKINTFLFFFFKYFNSGEGHIQRDASLKIKRNKVKNVN